MGFTLPVNESECLAARRHWPLQRIQGFPDGIRQRGDGTPARQRRLTLIVRSSAEPGCSAAQPQDIVMTTSAKSAFFCR
jgi:hypothetical protein